MDPHAGRSRAPSYRAALPCAITLLALCMGVTAIRLAFEDRFEEAVAAIVAAALLDGMDGKVARLLKGQSRFGVELDSLADLVSFGVAPALLLHRFVLEQSGGLGWAVALVFATAACIRLARFNVLAGEQGGPPWKGEFFVGTPTPAGALLALLPLYLWTLGVEFGPSRAPLVLAYVAAVSWLMVSNVPVLSGKQARPRLRRRHLLPAMIALPAGAGLLMASPFLFMTLGAFAYLATIPFGVMRYRRLERIWREASRGGGAGPGTLCAVPGSLP